MKKKLIIGGLAAIAASVLIPGCGGHSKDWYYGHDVSTDAAISLYNMGGADNARDACASAVNLGAMFDSSMDVDDAVDGCLAGVEERKPRWA